MGHVFRGQSLPAVGLGLHKCVWWLWDPLGQRNKQFNFDLDKASVEAGISERKEMS